MKIVFEVEKITFGRDGEYYAYCKTDDTRLKSTGVTLKVTEELFKQFKEEKK